MALWVYQRKVYSLESNYLPHWKLDSLYNIHITHLDIQCSDEYWKRCNSLDDTEFTIVAFRNWRERGRHHAEPSFTSSANTTSATTD